MELARSASDRADQPHTPTTHVNQPFFCLLVILLQYQTFCYSVLSHSGKVNSAILL
jgi:hypothetical protein